MDDLDFRRVEIRACHQLSHAHGGEAAGAELGACDAVWLFQMRSMQRCYAPAGLPAPKGYPPESPHPALRFVVRQPATASARLDCDLSGGNVSMT